MKAIAQTSYGPPDALQCLETPKPSPKDDEVLSSGKVVINVS